MPNLKQIFCTSVARDSLVSRRADHSVTCHGNVAFRAWAAKAGSCSSVAVHESRVLGHIHEARVRGVAATARDVERVASVVAQQNTQLAGVLT